MTQVLIIDDEEQVNDALAEVVKSMFHNAFQAFTLEEGLKAAVAGRFDIIFLDVKLPDGSGLDILSELRGLQSRPEIIIITGKGDPDGAETAIRNGAWDYLQKPFSAQQVVLHLTRIMQYREGLKKRRKNAVALKMDRLIGNSPQMAGFLDSVAQAANSDANALILGETGTGKELCARTIHANSARAANNLVVVDCAALPPTLVESSLFGFEKGSFTGADHAREGLIRQADKGSLFLDEIGELSLEHQKSFLRVLQEKQFRPIGSKNEIKCDFRLIAATNQDLDQLVDMGKFRKDLLFRLKAISIIIPPLRKHPEDIRELVIYYINKISVRQGINAKGYSPEFIEALCAYPWPGNIRELVNVVEYAFSSAQFETTLSPRHLPEYIRIHLAKAKIITEPEALSGDVPEDSDHNKSAVHIPSYRDYRQNALIEADKKYFNDLLISTRGSLKEACRISGLGRTRLYTQLKRYNISRFGWPEK